MKKLLAIERKVYEIIPETGSYQVYDDGDWSSTATGTIIPSTNKVYVTTTFNNLWELSLTDHSTRKISWDGWGTCNALVPVPTTDDDSNSNTKYNLFAFCHKLWLIDDLNTGHCVDFLGGYTNVWTRVNAATAIDDKIYCTTSANNLWCIDTSPSKEDPKKLGGGSDNWSVCKSLINVNGMLLAFCYWLWKVDKDDGTCKPFFDDDDENSKRNWLSFKCATVIDNNVYIVLGSQLLELDTVTKKIREVSNENWNLTALSIILIDYSLWSSAKKYHLNLHI
nr:3459_t:CDS:2 [Entrophospora candida]